MLSKTSPTTEPVRFLKETLGPEMVGGDFHVGTVLHYLNSVLDLIQVATRHKTRSRFLVAFDDGEGGIAIFGIKGGEIVTGPSVARELADIVSQSAPKTRPCG